MSGDTVITVVGNLTDEVIGVACRVSEFWRQVDQSAGPGACWPWTGYGEDGYGSFYFCGRMIGAHELAVTFTTGELRLPDLDTCHSCSNPPCCNPAHLRFDTRRSNIADMDTAGRRFVPQDRVTDEQVRMIRRRREAGAPLDLLADAYGVSSSYVSMLINGLRRRSAGGPISERRHYRKAG